MEKSTKSSFSAVDFLFSDKLLGKIIGAFKSISTNAYIKGVKQNNWQSFQPTLWQRNFYEHVIRDENSYFKISEYIEYNPAKWCEDKYFEPN